MPRRKTGKRARPVDPEQDLSQPIAKRLNQMDLNEMPQNCDVLNGNNSSSVQLTGSDDSSCSRALMWQPLGIGPVLDRLLTAAYDPEIPATDNPHYYQDSSCSRALMWQPLGIDPVLDRPLTAAYDPEIPATDNPHYYQDSSCSRALMWQPLGIDPVLDRPLTAAYDPEIPATDNPHYYQVNKVLHEAHVQWIQRQQPFIDP